MHTKTYLWNETSEQRKALCGWPAKETGVLAPAVLPMGYLGKHVNHVGKTGKEVFWSEFWVWALGTRQFRMIVSKMDFSTWIFLVSVVVRIRIPAQMDSQRPSDRLGPGSCVPTCRNTTGWCTGGRKAGVMDGQKGGTHSDGNANSLVRADCLHWGRVGYFFCRKMGST